MAQIHFFFCFRRSDCRYTFIFSGQLVSFPAIFFPLPPKHWSAIWPQLRQTGRHSFVKMVHLHVRRLFRLPSLRLSSSLVSLSLFIALWRNCANRNENLLSSVKLKPPYSKSTPDFERRLSKLAHQEGRAEAKKSFRTKLTRKSPSANQVQPSLHAIENSWSLEYCARTRVTFWLNWWASIYWHRIHRLMINVPLWACVRSHIRWSLLFS